MLITVDVLAQRYGLLPSEVLNRASTFDLRVMELANMKVKREQDIREGKLVPQSKHNLTPEQMKAMIQQVRNT